MSENIEFVVARVANKLAEDGFFLFVKEETNGDGKPELSLCVGYDGEDGGKMALFLPTIDRVGQIVWEEIVDAFLRGFYLGKR